MSTWFLCKISYLKRTQDGLIRKVSDSYLFEAISFTEAEARIYEQLSQEIPEFVVVSISKTKFTDVVFHDLSDTWYKIKISFSSVDADTGKEKKLYETLLLKANDVKDACEKMINRLKNMQLISEITDISKTPILDVFPFTLKDSLAESGGGQAFEENTYE